AGRAASRPAGDLAERPRALRAHACACESSAGGRGKTAAEGGATAPADGHTLLLVVPGNGIAHVLNDKLNFNFIQDTAPVAGISNGPLVNGGQFSDTGPYSPRVYCLRQSQTGQGQFCVAWCWVNDPTVRRAVQDNGRRQDG